MIGATASFPNMPSWLAQENFVTILKEINKIYLEFVRNIV